jgi:hypothetical protein
MADSILGKVTINGIDAQGWGVSAKDGAGALTGPVQTGPDGTYAIPALAAGTYSVSLTALDGFQSPADKTNNVIAGAGGADVIVDFALTSVLSGKVSKRAAGGPQRLVKATQVVTTNGKQDPVEVKTQNDGAYVFTELKSGKYTVSVADLAGEPKYLPAQNIEIIAGVSVKGIDFSEDIVGDFLGRLDDTRFSIESLISDDEANQAVSLFSVVNLMLAGRGRRQVGNEEKMDMLGVLNLYYGLQEDSLRNIITVGNPTALWSSLEIELKDLAKQLDQLQSDAEFLNREAKRQFNLGLSNNVQGNNQFPALFRRYVEIGNDPLLSFNIQKTEDDNQFFDKTKIAQADDLLKELKGVILQLVRSLSKYGTAGTKRMNEDWAQFEARALEVLQTVARERVSSDQDEKNPWMVLADLTGKNRDVDVAPYVVLARHGGKLLNYAMQIYHQTQNELENFDTANLRKLFQSGNPADFWTERIRKEATVIKRYPLANWG